MFPLGGLVRLSVPLARASHAGCGERRKADQPLLHVFSMGGGPGRTSTAEAIGELLV